MQVTQGSQLLVPKHKQSGGADGQHAVLCFSSDFKACQWEKVRSLVRLENLAIASLYGSEERACINKAPVSNGISGSDHIKVCKNEVCGVYLSLDGNDVMERAVMRGRGSALAHVI